MTELTILMPCLNEKDSLPFCIGEARGFLDASGVDGEILVADNGSTDGSREVAASCGARVVDIKERGYGAALRGGIAAARGQYVIMADCDGSYDLEHLEPYLEALRNGAVLAIGDRYGLGFEKGASPFSHRVIGVPVLSLLGRLAQRRYKPPKSALVHDFHCGLRGVERQTFLKLGATSNGMEFASEMILLVTRAGQKIVQIPAGLRPDLRKSTSSHINAISDGMRHVKLISKFFKKPQKDG